MCICRQFNHADSEIKVCGVDEAPWKDKQMVQLFMKEQEEEVFRLRYSGAALSSK